jgi:Transmembrane domain of unknown function (DUF3566)
MSQPTSEPGTTGPYLPTDAGASTPATASKTREATSTNAPAASPSGPPKPTAMRPAPVDSKRKARRRHARVVIRKVGPWTVFKVSIVFYLCVMLVLLGAGVILYGLLGAIGALDSTTRLIRDLFADQTFVINGRWLFTRGLGIGLLMVVVWSLINVFVAFLYNLISDLVGGVEVTLAERR